MNQLLFVYGSLRSGFRHPAFDYISENFLLLGPAKVRGLLFDLGEFPAAIPTIEESYLFGELYQLREDRDFSWVIEQIDDYEGVHVEAGEIPDYRRELATATLDATGGQATAWIYWYNREISGRPRVLSGDVIEYLAAKNRT